MFRFFLLPLAVLTFPFYSFSQDTECNPDSANFIKYFGTDGNDMATVIERIGDEGYLAGWGNFSKKTCLVHLTFMDLCGNLVWQKAFNETEYGIPVGIVYNNGLIHVACQKSTPDIKTSIITLDIYGAIISSMSFQTDNIVYPRNMIATNDGNLVLCGVVNSSEGAGNNDFYICKVTYDGNFLWKKTIGNNFHNFGNNVIEDASGNLLFCGYTSDEYNDVHKASAIKFDSSGNLLWAQEYHMGTGLTNLAFLEQSGDNYYFAGSSNSTTTIITGETDGLIIKTDLDGNIIWSNFYGTSGIDKISGVSKKNDTLYVSGLAYSSSKGSEVFIAKINEDGGIIDYTSLGSDSSDFNVDYGTNFGIEDNGFYGITNGNTGILGNNDILFYRFNSFEDNCDPGDVILDVIPANILANPFINSTNTPGWAFINTTYAEFAFFGADGFLCDGDGNGNPSDTTPVIPPPVVIDSTYIFKPVNIFTPNNDGINDVFTFKKYASNIREFYCTIINRWGVIVGEFEGINNSWDGKDLSGSQCTDGVYFYTYQAETYGGYKFNGQGTVQIIGTGVGN